jgi:hypothetical protein
MSPAKELSLDFAMADRFSESDCNSVVHTPVVASPHPVQSSKASAGPSETVQGREFLDGVEGFERSFQRLAFAITERQASGVIRWVLPQLASTLKGLGKSLQRLALPPIFR